jgi:hypothetical protein
MMALAMSANNKTLHLVGGAHLPSRRKQTHSVRASFKFIDSHRADRLLLANRTRFRWLSTAARLAENYLAAIRSVRCRFGCAIGRTDQRGEGVAAVISAGSGVASAGRTSCAVRAVTGECV